jgi:hypothetical protein
LELYETLEAGEVTYAIRLPVNDNLARNITELLKQPVGRPSYRPAVRYQSFLYQAASWKIEPRMMAKVESHSGELFPRVGFIFGYFDAKTGAGVVKERCKERLCAQKQGQI